MAEKTNANLGWLFYKDYYRSPDIDWDNLKKDEKTEKVFRQKNEVLFQAAHHEELIQYFVKGKQQLHFKTTYPGLLIGSGYNHETGAMGEIKIGFYFDYTTGLPTVPGSSVKGVVRSAFDHPDYIGYLLKEKMKIETLPDLEALETEMFTGANRKNMYEHDVFYDAFLSDSDSGKILDDDFITPHKHPLKDPIPIQFLKVLPGVTLTFNFDLKDGVITADEKKELIKLIIADLGVGAKTNVGYGYLIIK